MSVMVATRTKTDVILAADSLWSSAYPPWEAYRWTDPEKIVRREDAGVLIGTCGSPRLVQAAQLMPLARPAPAAGRKWVAETFAVDLLRQAQEHVGELRGSEPGLPLGSAVVVVAWGAQLWTISSDLMVREVQDYVAIGAGRHWAYGALDALDGLDLDPLTRVHRSLEAAGRFCMSVAGPFSYVRTSAVSELRRFPPLPISSRSLALA